MEPLNFNPLDSSGNYIGTNPLQPTGIPIRTTVVSLGTAVPYGVSCFDPSLYQPYTFFSYAFPPYSYAPTTYLKTTLLGSSVIYSGTTYSVYVSGYSEYATTYESQFSTFFSTYAAFYQINPVVFSIRFGTELQTLYGSTSFATNVIATYQNIYSIVWLTYNLQNPGQVFSSLFASGLVSSNLIKETLLPQQNGSIAIGSSTFVDMLGSNVYSALLDTTNSVIIYQNEQINTYYSQSLSYQINVINLTTALNSLASVDNTGQAYMTFTTFSWTWESSANGWSGYQVTNFPDYIQSAQVKNYVYVYYGGTTVTDSNTSITTAQSLISIQNNYLANAQTLLNNAVTTLQSQVSLAGQIITALASGMETLINDI
jgi:hypothetical protein